MPDKASQDKTLARRIATLKDIPLFAGLHEKELVTIVDDFRRKEYAKDELIFRQGDESREVYVILKGKIRIYRISPAGNETTTNLSLRWSQLFRQSKLNFVQIMVDQTMHIVVLACLTQFLL